MTDKGGIGMEACHDQRENILLYAYGELDSNSGKEVEKHLENCESCHNEYQRLSALLGKIRETVKSPVLSPQQVKSLVTNIKWKLKNRRRTEWWRRYLQMKPLRLVPAVSVACILIITAGIIGYVKMNETNGLQPFADNQGEELMLSDGDLEIVNNLELLKELDAIQKLSRVVDLNNEPNPRRKVEPETRGMRQDAYRNYFV
jgi:hypothetical protein